jgi:hypothetical protein
MSLRSPNNGDNRRCDLDILGKSFFDTADGLRYPLPVPPSPLRRLPINPLRPFPAQIQSTDGPDSAKNYGTACIVNHALKDLSSNSGGNEANPRVLFELAMNNADLDDMDDDLSAAEFNPATSMVGANHNDISIGMSIDILDDMDDDLSLAEFHLPTSVEPAPLPSMDLFGNQNRNINTNNININPMGNNHWRGIATRI